jgi:tRNA1Val (adenine37-N6)-methyltransferase
MGSIFQFKHFKVDQTDCAMRINTDGVILGASAAVKSPDQILDIGTGTGVIAMMLAQRYPNAWVDAVEIEVQAAHRAAENLANSPFANRSEVIHSDINEYVTYKKYDLIVSNPPFFVNDLKSAEVRKGIARHAHESFFIKLIIKAATLLTEKGSLWLILPVKQSEWVILNAALYSMFPNAILQVHSDRNKDAFRQIISLTFNKTLTLTEQLFIYESQGVYTGQYKKLLKEFFLDF